MLVEEFFTTATTGLAAAMSRALPDGAVVTFELEGAGGGVWTLERSGDEIAVLREEPEVVDCRLSCTVQDFVGLVTGEIDGVQGFYDGRLRIEGDVGLVMRLQHVVAPTVAGGDEPAGPR